MLSRSSSSPYDLVSCSPNEVKVWRRGRCVRTLREPRNCLSCFEVIGRNDVAVGHHTGKIVHHDIQTNTEKHVLSVPNSSKSHHPVLSLCRITPYRLVSGCWDKTIRLWDLSSSRHLRTLHGHTSSIQSVVRLSRTRFLSASCDGDVRIWDITVGGSGSGSGSDSLNDRRPSFGDSSSDSSSSSSSSSISSACVGVIKAHTHYVLATCLLSRYCFATASFQELKIWDFRKLNPTGKTPVSCVKTLLGHSGWVYSLLPGRFFGNEARGRSLLGGSEGVVSGGAEGAVRVWSVQKGRSVRRWKAGILSDAGTGAGAQTVSAADAIAGVEANDVKGLAFVTKEMFLGEGSGASSGSGSGSGSDESGSSSSEAQDPLVAVAVGQTIQCWSLRESGVARVRLPQTSTSQSSSGRARVASATTPRPMMHSAPIQSLRLFVDPLSSPLDVVIGGSTPAPSGSGSGGPAAASVRVRRRPETVMPSGAARPTAQLREVLDRHDSSPRMRGSGASGGNSAHPSSRSKGGGFLGKKRPGPPVPRKGVRGREKPSTPTTSGSATVGGFTAVASSNPFTVGRRNKPAPSLPTTPKAAIHAPPPPPPKPPGRRRHPRGRKRQRTGISAEAPASIGGKGSSSGSPRPPKQPSRDQSKPNFPTMQPRGARLGEHKYYPPTKMPTPLGIGVSSGRTRKASFAGGALESEIASFREEHENESIGRNDLAAIVSLLSRRLERMIPQTYESAFMSLSGDRDRLMQNGNLEGFEGEVARLEHKFTSMRERMARQVEMLKLEDFFILIERLDAIKRNRQAYLRTAEDRLRKVTSESRRQRTLKQFLRTNARTKELVVLLQKIAAEMSSVRKMVQDKLNDHFIEKKKSLDAEFAHQADLLLSRGEAEQELVSLFEDRQKVFQEYPDLQRYFPDYDAQKLAVDGEFQRLDLFFAAIKEIDGELQSLIDNVPFDTMRRHFDDILKKQEARDQLYASVENDFRSLNLKNNRDIDRLHNSNGVIGKDIDTSLGHIARHCELFERKIPNLLQVKVERDSLKRLEEEIITEVVNVQDVLHEMRKKLLAIREANQVVYGKLYSDEGPALTKIFRRKKLRYFGQLKSGVEHGFGKEFFEDGQTVKFYGRFKDGVRHGGGEEYDIEGSVISKGEWQENSAQVMVFDMRRIMQSVDPLTDLLGKGSFGEVYKITLEGVTRAMKRILLTKDNSREIERFRNEVALLSRMKHPHVVRIIGWSEYEDDMNVQFGLITEYCPTRIQSLYGTGQLSFARKLKILWELADGMTFLHSKDVIHRDLKFENVLLGDDGAVRLIDFGLSKQLETYRLTQKMTAAAQGTPGYVAPEVIENMDYNEKCDLFSFGIMMFCILCETDDPFDASAKSSEDAFYAFKIPRLVVDEDLRPVVPDTYLQNPRLEWFLDLMRDCWAGDPERRPSFEEVKGILRRQHERCKAMGSLNSIPVVSRLNAGRPSSDTRRRPVGAAPRGRGRQGSPQGRGSGRGAGSPSLGRNVRPTPPGKQGRRPAPPGRTRRN